MEYKILESDFVSCVLECVQKRFQNTEFKDELKSEFVKDFKEKVLEISDKDQSQILDNISNFSDLNIRKGEKIYESKVYDSDVEMYLFDKKTMDLVDQRFKIFEYTDFINSLINERFTNNIYQEKYSLRTLKNKDLYQIIDDLDSEIVDPRLMASVLKINIFIRNYPMKAKYNKDLPSIFLDYNKGQFSALGFKREDLLLQTIFYPEFDDQILKELTKVPKNSEIDDLISQLL